MCDRCDEAWGAFLLKATGWSADRLRAELEANPPPRITAEPPRKPGQVRREPLTEGEIKALVQEWRPRSRRSFGSALDAFTERQKAAGLRFLAEMGGART